MKRTSILGAIAALALVALPFVSVAPASATVIAPPCAQINPGGANYPDKEFSQRCSGTVADAGQMHDGVSNQSWNEMARAGVKLYFVATAQDYVDSAVGLGLGAAEPVTEGRFGVTHFDANKKPVYIAIFAKNANNVVNTEIKHNTAYEVGRAMDYLLGYIMNGGIVTASNSQVSASPAARNLYVAQINKDWTSVNSLTPCGTTGLFSGRQDSAGAYICTTDVNGQGKGPNLAAPYFALPSCGAAPTSPCNQNVLKAVWPLTFSTSDRIFAEQYALPSPRVSNYMASFACSNVIQKTASLNGNRIAVAADFIPLVGCPVPTITTKCLKLWPGAPATVERIFPDGNVFNCSLAGNGNQQAVANDVLNGLKSLGGGGVTQIKRELTTTARANVFVFISTADYTNAFTTASEFIPGGVGATVASTYPSPNPQGIWFTILFTDRVGTAPVGSNFLYTASHELGHTCDDTRATQPSSLPTFDRAMQNDWLTLNYTAYPVKQQI